MKGFSGTQILNRLQISKSTVYDALKRFDDVEDLSDCPQSGRKKSVCTKALIKNVQEKIWQNPSLSMRRLSQEYNVSEKTICRVMKDDLKMRSFKL